MKMKIVGVDLGGTTFTVGLVDESGKIIKRLTRETHVEEGKDRVMERIAEAVNDVTTEDVEYVGIGSPGSIDRDRGIVRFSPNFPDWWDVPLADEIERRTGKKVFIENDANSFVLGEKWFGAGKNYDHIVALTLGTGIGGGVITHGRLLTGSTGIGAELGHIVIEPNGPVCGCGVRGCLEAVASGTAIKKFAMESYKKFPDSKIFAMAGGPDKVTPKDVFEAVLLGDRLATLIRDRVVDALARAIASYVHTFNPQVIIIGGGISRAGDVLFDPLNEKVNDYVMPSFLGTFKIVRSKLLDDAGVLGAVSIVLNRLSERGEGHEES